MDVVYVDFTDRKREVCQDKAATVGRKNRKGRAITPDEALAYEMRSFAGRIRMNAGNTARRISLENLADDIDRLAKELRHAASS